MKCFAPSDPILTTRAIPGINARGAGTIHPYSERQVVASLSLLFRQTLGGEPRRISGTTAARLQPAAAINLNAARCQELFATHAARLLNWREGAIELRLVPSTARSSRHQLHTHAARLTALNPPKLVREPSIPPVRRPKEGSQCIVSVRCGVVSPAFGGSIRVTRMIVLIGTRAIR